MIRVNLAIIKKSIAAAEKKYGRVVGEVVLVAVSKSQSVEKVRIVAEDGQIHFGENYLQEALPKIRELVDLKLVWHYIGRIQTNKIKFIAPNFNWVETVSSYNVAELLNKHRPLGLPPLNVCIQVNIGRAASKGGVLTEEILPLAKKILLLPKLKLRGLMVIPEYRETFDEQIAIFRQLERELKTLQQSGILVDTLSMGMSEDFEAAIAAGATMVRIGSAVFGKRV